MTTATTQPITELEQFADLIVNWHSYTLTQIDHLANVPETEALEITDFDTEQVIQLTGTERAAFIQGLLVAKTMLYTLPFTLAEAVTDEA